MKKLMVAVSALICAGVLFAEDSAQTKWTTLLDQTADSFDKSVWNVGTGDDIYVEDGKIVVDTDIATGAVFTPTNDVPADPLKSAIHSKITFDSPIKELPRTDDCNYQAGFTLFTNEVEGGACTFKFLTADGWVDGNENCPPAELNKEYDLAIEVDYEQTIVSYYLGSEGAEPPYTLICKGTKGGDGNTFSNLAVKGTCSFSLIKAGVESEITKVNVMLPGLPIDGVEELVVSQSVDGVEWTKVENNEIDIDYYYVVVAIPSEGYRANNPIASGIAVLGEDIEVTKDDVKAKVKQYVVQIDDGEQYTSFAEAFSNATDGATIKFLADFEGSIGDDKYKGVSNFVNGLTIDLNEKIWTLTGGNNGTHERLWEDVRGNTFLFKNGSIKAVPDTEGKWANQSAAFYTYAETLEFQDVALDFSALKVEEDEDPRKSVPIVSQNGSVKFTGNTTVTLAEKQRLVTIIDRPNGYVPGTLTLNVEGELPGDILLYSACKIVVGENTSLKGKVYTGAANRSGFEPAGALGSPFVALVGKIVPATGDTSINTRGGQLFTDLDEANDAISSAENKNIIILNNVEEVGFELNSAAEIFEISSNVTFTSTDSFKLNDAKVKLNVGGTLTAPGLSEDDFVEPEPGWELKNEGNTWTVVAIDQVTFAVMYNPKYVTNVAVTADGKSVVIDENNSCTVPSNAVVQITADIAPDANFNEIVVLRNGVKLKLNEENEKFEFTADADGDEIMIEATSPAGITLPDEPIDGVEELVVSQSVDGVEWTEVNVEEYEGIHAYNKYIVIAIPSEGYRADNPITNGVAESYKDIEVTPEQVEAKVTKIAYVAQIVVDETTTNKYETLKAAFDAALDDQTITLLMGVTLEDTLVIDKKITLEMNGNEIKLAADKTIGIDIKENTVKISGGSIKSALTENVAGSKAITIPNKNVKLENVTVDAAHYEYAIYANCDDDCKAAGDDLAWFYTDTEGKFAELKCDGVTITGNGSLFHVEGMKATLNNCSATYDDNPLFADFHQAAVYSSVNADTTITGTGTYTHTNALQSGNLGGKITVAEGSTAAFAGDIKSWMVVGAHLELEQYEDYVAQFSFHGGTYNGEIVFVDASDEARDLDLFVKDEDVTLNPPNGYLWNEDGKLVPATYTVTVNIGENITALVTNKTQGGEAIVFTESGDFTVNYGDYIAVKYTCSEPGYEASPSAVAQGPIKTNTNLFRSKKSVIKYTITYNDYGEWAEGFTPVTEYTIETPTFQLPGADDVKGRSGGEFKGWTNELGVATNDVKKGTTGNLAFYAVWEQTGTDEVKEVIDNNVDGFDNLDDAAKKAARDNAATLYEACGSKEATEQWIAKVYGSDNKIAAATLAGAPVESVQIAVEFDVPLMVEPTISAPVVAEASQGPAAFEFAIKDGTTEVEIKTLTENVKKIVKYAAALGGTNKFGPVEDKVTIGLNEGKIKAEFVAGPAAGFMKADFNKAE